MKRYSFSLHYSDFDYVCFRTFVSEDVADAWRQLFIDLRTTYSFENLTIIELIDCVEN